MFPRRWQLLELNNLHFRHCLLHSGIQFPCVYSLVQFPPEEDFCG